MMSSLENFQFSPITIISDLPSPPLRCIYSKASSDFIDDLLIEHNLHPDNADPPPFDPSVFDSFSDAPFEGFADAESNVFNTEPPNLLEPQVTPSSENIECQITESIEEDSTVIETSDVPSHSNFIKNTQVCECEKNESLRLLTPPHAFQRARYEGELDEDLRYISTPNNKGIELKMPDLRSRIPANMSVMIRVTRTTIPYGPDQIICCHPYPLYTKNEHAIAHSGSILLPVTDKNMEEELIGIDDLIMQRSKQPTLKRITQLPIYTSNQLDCNGFHSIDINKPKAIITTYNLRYSVLRFQIFLFDENQIAHATNLLCETTPIYEYEKKERENLPAPFGGKRKRQTKHLQQESTTTQKKRANTQKKTKIKRLKGLIRTTNSDF